MGEMALFCVDILLFRCKVPYGIAHSLLFRDLDLGIHYLKRKLFCWKLISQLSAIREILHRCWPAEITSAAVVFVDLIIAVQGVTCVLCSSDLMFVLPVVTLSAVIQIC